MMLRIKTGCSLKGLFQWLMMARISVWPALDDLYIQIDSRQGQGAETRGGSCSSGFNPPHHE